MVDGFCKVACETFMRVFRPSNCARADLGSGVSNRRVGPAGVWLAFLPSFGRSGAAFRSDPCSIVLLGAPTHGIVPYGLTPEVSLGSGDQHPELVGQLCKPRPLYQKYAPHFVRRTVLKQFSRLPRHVMFSMCTACLARP